MIKNIVMLGSTGSIGRQAIEVALSRPEEFKIIGLAAKSNAKALVEQAERISPEYICLVDKDAAQEARSAYKGPAKVVGGDEGLREIASLDEADIILNAIVGSAGLQATLEAIKANKIVALANKESLVAGGPLVNQAINESRGKILPVDSEHNALFQCLIGESGEEVARLILTASGGPFWGRAEAELDRVTPAEALSHPRWRMGPRITVDSATLMNKGFEVIEAHWLFGLEYERIEVIIHPQSIVHSLVEFVDGSIKAQLGPTDMRVPILYSFSWPKRLTSNLEPLNLAQIGCLEFFPADRSKLKCLSLAYEAARLGRSYPTALNGADEIAVENFLNERIGFNEIGNIIDIVLERHEPVEIESVSDFESVDEWAKNEAGSVVKEIHHRSRF